MSIFNESYVFTSASVREMCVSELIQIPLSNTSKGVLCKWNGFIGNDLYYIKTGKLNYGKFSNLEPISECIAYEIGKLMDINVIPSFCSDVDLKGSDNHMEQTITVSYTKNFLNKGEVFYSIYNLDALDNSYNGLTYEYIDYVDEINKMIIFDFVINNRDRHLNNFGFILDEDSLDIKRFNPLFDNGNSLLSDLSEYELIEYSGTDIDKYSDCKPFINNHFKQLELVNRLPNINLNFDRKEIEKIVNNFSTDITRRRVTAIVNLIIRRINYVKRLYSKI